MANFTPSGVEFIARNITGYLNDLGRADRAQQDLGKSVNNLVSKFGSAKTPVAEFGSSINRLNFGSLSQKISSAIPGLGSLGKALGNVMTIATGIVAAQVFNKIASGIGAAVSAGFNFNNAMEQASAKINAFVKDGELTKQILADIRTEAANTPFEFQAMADATAGLLPAARQAGEGIMDLVRDAEVLAASNPAEGLEGAAFALREAVSGDFTSVIERFNLPRSMINDLKEQGLPNLEIVRKAMQGMGFDMDLVSALANTASGRWSTFKDTLTNVAGTVTKPIFDAFSSKLGDVNAWLTANEPMLTSFADMLAGKVAEGITFVTEKATELIAAFQTGGFTGLSEALGIPPEVLDGIKAAADTIQGLFDTFTTGMEASGIGGGFSALFEKLDFSGMLQGLVDKIVPEIPNVLTKIIDGISDFLTNNWPTIQETLTEWGDKFWTWVNEIAVPKTGETLSSLLTAVADWSTSSETQTKLSGIGQVVGKSVADGVGLFFANQEEIGKLMLTIAGGLLAGVGVALGSLIAVGSALVAGITAGELKALGVDLQPATIDELGTVLGNIGRDIGTIASELGKRLVNWIKTGWDKAWKTVSGWAEGFQDLTEEILPMLTESFDFVTESAKKFLDMLSSIGSTIADLTIPDWLEGQSPPPLADSFDFIATSAARATKAVSGFMAGLSGAASTQGLEQAKSILDSFSFQGLFSAEGLSGTGAAVSKKALSDVFWSNLSGIITGTTNQAQFINEVVAKVPDKYRDETGRVLWANINQLFSTLQAELGNATGALFTELVSKAGSFSNLAGGFAGMLKGQISALQKGKEEQTKLTDKNKQLTGTIIDQREQLSILKRELEELTTAQKLDTIAIDKKKFAIEELNEKLEANQQTIMDNQAAMVAYRKELESKIFGGFDFFASGQEKLEGDLAMIELLQEFLKGTGEEFRLIGAELGGIFAGTGATADVVHTRISAQERLNELLAEQVKREEAILQAQKAQQQLDFLSRQLELIELGKSLGGNIFEGMTFGLNASIEDMLAATNAVVQAMVNQINDSLQIHSPSGVMIDIFGQVMKGAAIGLEKGRSLLDQTIQGIPLLSGALMQPMAAPAFAGGGGVGAYNGPLVAISGVTISSGMDEDIFFRRVEQVVADVLR